MNHDSPYGGKSHGHPGESLLISDSTVNVIKGVVHCQEPGLIRTTVHIRSGHRIDLRVKLPLNHAYDFLQGQQVIATIPAEAVRLEAGLFRRSRQRLNRWYGRIVLLQPLSEGQFITAKLHGEGWTLTSTMPILGSTHSPRTWDPVTIVVDPQAIELVPYQRVTLPRLKVLSQSRFVYQ